MNIVFGSTFFFKNVQHINMYCFKMAKPLLVYKAKELKNDQLKIQITRINYLEIKTRP